MKKAVIFLALIMHLQASLAMIIRHDIDPSLVMVEGNEQVTINKTEPYKINGLSINNDE